MYPSERNWIAAGAAIALLAACGGQPKPPAKDKDQPKEQPTTTPTTGAVVPVPTKDEPVVVPEVWQQIPQSAFVVGAFHRPTQSAKQLQETLSKLGLFAGFYKEFDLDDFREEFGFDLFDADAMKRMGIDESKGIAIGADSQLTQRRHWYQQYAATVEINKEPGTFVVFSLTDPKAFDAWLRGAITKDHADAKFEEEKIGDLSALYVTLPEPSYDMPGEAPMIRAPSPPKPPTPTSTSATPKVRLEVAVVTKGSYVYVFPSSVSSSEFAEVPDPIAAFKKELVSFFERTSTSITKQESFNKVGAKLQKNSDFFFYMNTDTFGKTITGLDTREMIFLATTNEDQKRAQEDQKRYQAEDAKYAAERNAVFTTIATAFPAWGMSAILEKDKAQCAGYAMLGGAFQPAFATLLSPSAAAPNYGTIFPEDTTFVVRQSFNPSALKSLISMFINDQRDKEEFEKAWQTAASMTPAVGLDFEKDIIGGVTGHMALGAPDMSIFIAPLFMGRSVSAYPEPYPPIERAPVPAPMPMPPGLQDVPAPVYRKMPPPPPSPQMAFPSAVGVIQLTSTAAGEKFIKAIETMAPMAALTIKTEEVEGVKVYSATIPEPAMTIAWSAINDLFVGGTDLERVKNTVKRIKTPGASFADKLPSALSKSLITDKAANGCTADIGGLFSWMLKQPELGSDISAYAIPLSTSLGTSTMKITSDEAGIACHGELTLR